MKRLECLSVVIFALLTIFANSCISMEPSTYSIYLENESDNELYVLYRWKYADKGHFSKEYELCKDSTLYDYGEVGSGRWQDLWEFDKKPEDFLKPTDTLTVFILDKEEYEGKTWSQLVDSAHFRQIYHLSGDDIRLLKSDIPYPPNEKMRNMDMVPRYEDIER